MAAVKWWVKSSISGVYSNQKNCFPYVHPRTPHPNRASAIGLPSRSGWEASLKVCAADYDISSNLALRPLHPLPPHFDVPQTSSCNDPPPLLLCLRNSYCMLLSLKLHSWPLKASYAIFPPYFHSHLDCCYLDFSRHLPGTTPRSSYVGSLFL